MYSRYAVNWLHNLSDVLMKISLIATLLTMYKHFTINQLQGLSQIKLSLSSIFVQSDHKSSQIPLVSVTGDKKYTRNRANDLL